MWQTYSKKGKKCEIWCDLIIHTGNEINAVLLIWVSTSVYVIVFRFSTELCAVLRLSGPLKSQYAKVCIIYVYKSFIITYYFVIILY